MDSAPKIDTHKTSYKVLIVEDDLVLSKMYEEKFKLEGFSVLIARDGGEGYQLALNEKIDCILLDLMLPRVSGFEMLERLSEDEDAKKIPVIALTNLAERDEREKVLKLGAREYLVKAMQTPEQVVNKIKDYLRP